MVFTLPAEIAPVAYQNTSPAAALGYTGITPTPSRATAFSHIFNIRWRIALGPKPSARKRKRGMAITARGTVGRGADVLHTFRVC